MGKEVMVDEHVYETNGPGATLFWAGRDVLLSMDYACFMMLCGRSIPPCLLSVGGHRWGMVYLCFADQEAGICITKC